MTTENEGPAQALSVLYEANDLLNIFRSHSEDSLNQKLTSGEWTLTCEIKRRLDSAIAHLDGAVPHPADDGKAAEPDTDRFAIPDVIGKYRADQDRWAHDVHMAALDHAKHLRKAGDRLAKAKGLAETLRCALRSDDYDPEPFADDVAASIVDLLGKVQSQIDRHGTDHSNLFIAYHDRQGVQHE
jgi:hypothetical protein